MPRKLTKLALAGLAPMLLGLGTFVSHAAAHAPPLGLQLVWVDPAPEALPYVLSNRGLIYPNLNHQDGPDSAFSLRCYDAYHVNTSAVPRVVTNSQNALVLQTTDGVSTTSDRGCTWTEGTGLPDLSLGGFVQSPSAPNKMLVTTQIYEKPAQIFESTDYGRSWTVKATNAPYTIYSELLTSADGLHLFAAGKRYDVAKNNLFPVWASSSDGGATWTDQDVGTPRLPLGLLGDDGMVVFAHEPDPVTTLDPHDKLLRSEDGGQTFEMVANPAPISSFVATPDGATLWVGTTSGGLLRSRDRGKTFTQVDPDEVAGITCLHYHGNRLWVCANFMPNTNGIWYSTDQGDSFTMALDFTEVLTEVSCQPEAEAICHQPWLDWQYELATNFTVDAGTPLPDAGSQADGGRPLSSDAGQPASDSGDEVAPADAGALGDAGPSAPPPGPSRKNDDGGCSTTANQGLGAQLSGWLLAGFALLFLRRNKRG